MQYCNRFCAVSSLRPSIGCLRLTANHVRDVSPIFTVSVFQGVFWYLGHKTLSICYRGSLGRSFWDGEREQRAGHAGIRVAVSARFHREVRLKSRARGKLHIHLSYLPCAQGCSWRLPVHTSTGAVSQPVFAATRCPELSRANNTLSFFLYRSPVKSNLLQCYKFDLKCTYKAGTSVSNFD